jgi:hypothetical protein
MPTPRQTKGGQENEEVETIRRLVPMSHRTDRFIDQRLLLRWKGRRGFPSSRRWRKGNRLSHEARRRARNGDG